MALTPSGHKTAQSVSGTLFGTYSDGTYAYQSVVVRPASNHTNLTGSSTGEFSGSVILHRLVINQTTTGSITLDDGSLIAVIPAGTAPVSLEYSCLLAGDLTATCTNTEDFTVMWS